MRARLSAALAVFAIMTAPAMASTARRLPAVLAVGADYGLTVMNGASVPAHRFALFILSAEGYRTLAKHGFAARALPQ